MTKVVVDLKDLETAVFAAYAVKQIEQALDQRANDPFVKPHLQYAEAVERLLQTVRSEQRKASGTLVEWDGELTGEELAYLSVANSYDVLEIPSEERNPATNSYNPVIDQLAAKGCIVIGQVASAVVWPGESRPELKLDPGKYAVKITQRGKDKLAALANKQAAETQNASQV